MRRYHRVFSSSLDRKKHWYAYNSTIHGYPRSNRRHKGVEIFKSLSDEIRQIRLDDVRGSDGNLASYNWFNAGTRRTSDVMAITSFGILIMAIRQREVNEDFLNSELLGHVRSVVNSIPFEQFGTNFTNDDISSGKIQNDLYRLDCANTEVLMNQLKQQDAEITSLRTAASLMRRTKIPAEFQIPDARISTSEIIASSEITPPLVNQPFKIWDDQMTSKVKKNSYTIIQSNIILPTSYFIFLL